MPYSKKEENGQLLNPTRPQAQCFQHALSARLSGLEQEGLKRHGREDLDRPEDRPLGATYLANDVLRRLAICRHMMSQSRKTSLLAKL